MKIFFIGFSCVVFLVSAFAMPLHAEEEVTKDAQCQPDPHAVPPILDPAYRHNKHNQFEFAPYGGSYLGNTVGQTWVTGAKAYFHFNNTFALGASYGYSRLMTDRGSSFGQILKNTNMHIANVEAMIANDAAFRAGTSLIEMDFYLTMGGGMMLIDEKWKPMALIGGGVKIYPGLSWLAIRIDVNNLMHFTPKIGKDPFDADVVFTGGISFLFPRRASAYEK